MSSSAATGLWLRVQGDVDRRIKQLIGYWRVAGVTENGRLRVQSLDPEITGEREVRKLRGVPVDPGDTVLTVRIPGLFEVALGSLLREGQQDREMGIAFGNDGTEDVAARSDHQHRGTGANSLTIGEGGIALDRGVAVGRSAEARIDAVAIGHAAVARGTRSFAIGSGADTVGGDRGVLRANDVYVRRSDGTGATRLVLQDAGSVDRAIEVTSTGVRIGTVTLGGAILGMWTPNRTTASGGPWNIRNAPSTSGTVVATLNAGVAMVDTGTRVASGGFTWALTISHYGFTWVVQEALV